MKNSYFYNTVEIKQLKELIRTGEPLRQIAMREHANFDANFNGFYQKLLKIAKNTTKVREWDGPKMKRRAEQPQTQPVKGIAVPQGTTFEGTPRKVEIHTDHFRIYF